MRTTLKRGVGRGAGANGNGKAVYPPGPAPTPVTAVTRYRQPPPPTATGLGIFRRILVITLLGVTSLILGAVGGGYLYTHHFVASLRAHTPAVVRASRALDVPVANRAAVALVIGYDHRAGVEANRPSLSDTLMLIRADPVTKTISLLSFPRDLDVPIYCGATPSATDRINSAYSRCGPKGTVLTVRHLTGLPINYLITVNFHGFKQVVDTLGGIWMDVDRRYYNKNTGSYYDNYANINLQPGYQKLSGQNALDFVRFRHTDSDLTRVARQQEFVRAFKEQVAHSFTYTSIPHLVSTITKNIEVGEGGHALQLDQVISYALFAQGLPGGHLFQEKIENVTCGIGCSASTTDIQAAVDRFQNPDVQAPKDANSAALGQKVKQTAPPPSSVTVTVLNGNGVQGAAANASYLLTQRGYQALTPPNNLEPNVAQSFHSKIYYDPSQKGSKAAAVALQNLMQPADVAKLPRTPEHARPRSGLDADGGARPDVPRLDRAGADARRADAPAGQRPLRHGSRVPVASVREEGAVQADGADRARAELEPRHAPGRQAARLLLDGRQEPQEQGHQARLPQRHRLLGRAGNGLHGGACTQ